ncbi:MAG: peptidylprolyl isomerase [Candidatus Cloacimonetes bacterium]|nr:peptidylprolyl isomerase [Candidatus Cloacimonadota bacterium]MCB5286787.1 peptidylprolyl isomerase [Candidatus Cloacimonadota bacterium]MCK9184380.1 peptidylprolyl isomerase [Candidatus Cloacimonadota bacterium]MCK9585072.1 peptidylprolyl isomerase [Candidatus Cloacimonadota bacterium]MDY0229109.1 peptidylprolyl isomerase [Candidatus Cloacimonadaceae bacterium]
MQIIAKVVSHEISRKDLERELACGGTEEQALKRLIDRCLLLEKADQLAFSVSDDEFEIALMQLLDEDEPFGLPTGLLQDMDAQEMETLIRRNIIIRKYVANLYPANKTISEAELKELYQEQIESFRCEEMVRCSHILIKGEDALKRLTAIRAQIHSAEDFIDLCASYSECPSHKCCGDLGYFARGKLFTEIDEVAFSLQPGEISMPFESSEGAHILMLTDRRCKCLIPFEDIKESLDADLQQMEREYFLKRHLAELYKEFYSQILIFDDALK